MSFFRLHICIIDDILGNILCGPTESVMSVGTEVLFKVTLIEYREFTDIEAITLEKTIPKKNIPQNEPLIEVHSGEIIKH